MPIQRVGVLGCGLMGSGIAQVCATAGFDVTREVPFRITLLRSAREQHTVVLIVHHISFDGSSIAPLAAHASLEL